MKDTDTDPVAAVEDSTPAPETTTDDDQALWDELDREEQGEAAKDDLPAKPEPDDEDHFEDEDEDEDAQEPDDDDAGNADRPDDEDLQTQIQRIERQFRSEQERAKGQQRRADELQKEVERLSAALQAKTKDGQSEEDEERKQRLASVSEEYGDIVAPLLDEITRLDSRVSELSTTEAQRLENAKQEFAAIEEAEFNKLLAEHRDGFDVIAQNRELFAEWIEDQPKRLRDAYEQNRKHMVDGTGAALVVGHFKAALAASEQGEDTHQPQSRPTTRRDRQMRGARTTKQVTRRATTTRLSDDADPEDLWNEFERMEAGKG